MKPVSINDAEAVIEPFFDSKISNLADYDFQPAKGTGAQASPYWCWVSLSWDNAVPGQPIFTMSRAVDIVIEHYDALRIRCNIPGSAKLVFKAVVDGREQTVVNGVVGPDKKWEYTGPIKGKRLERLTIIYEAVNAGAGGGSLQWINLVNRQIEQIRNSRECPYTPDWPKFLKPPGEPVEVQPSLGLLFDQSELEPLRKKASHPAFKPLMDHLREKARVHLAAEPEKFVMESGATINRHHRAHEIARGTSDPANIAIVCGFVGLIDKDPNLLRMAGRAMLSMAHAEYWDECFQEHFPGSDYHHRAFTGMDNTYSCALGLDWAGDALTEVGRGLVCHAILDKGISHINKDFVREAEEVLSNNQGACFSQGRIAGLLALKPLWPRAQAWIDQAERDLLESIDLVFNANEDHGGKEGPGYVSATVLRALYGLVMLARHRNKSLSEITPPELIASSDFLLMFLSTAGPAGLIIPYGDSSGSYALDMPSLMAAAGGGQRWEALRRAMITEAKTPLGCRDSSVDGLHALILTDPPTQSGGVDVPEFCLLGSTGMVASCRQTPAGPVRLQLMGAAEGAGHVHQDKGSFILEAYGDALATDRGGVTSSNPLCEILKRAHFHNMLSPAKIGDRHAEQDMEVKTPILPRGTGNEQKLDVQIDTTSLWAGQFKKHVRRIVSPDPTLFFIDDAVEFAAPRGSTFHLHTSWPIAREGDGFMILGKHAQLIVTPTWPVTEAQFCEDLIDRDDQPVNHLWITSQPGVAYHLVTVMQVCKTNSEEQWHIEVREDEPRTVVAIRGEAQHELPTC